MILFACPLMFLLLPLPFLVRRFLPPVKGLHGDALRVPFLRDIADISIRSGGMWRAAAAGGEKTSPAFWSDGCRRSAAVAGRTGEDQGLRPRHYAGDGHFHFHAGA